MSDGKSANTVHEFRVDFILQIRIWKVWIWWIPVYKCSNYCSKCSALLYRPDVQNVRAFSNTLQQ